MALMRQRAFKMRRSAAAWRLCGAPRGGVMLLCLYLARGAAVGLGMGAVVPLVLKEAICSVV